MSFADIMAWTAAMIMPVTIAGVLFFALHHTRPRLAKILMIAGSATSAILIIIDTVNNFSGLV